MSASATQHWIRLRLTALAAIPLCVWLVFSIVSLAGADYATFTAWLKEPWNAGLMILTVLVSLWHGAMGVHEILEDYVHAPGLLKASLALKVLAFLAVGVACIGAIVKIAFLA